MCVCKMVCGSGTGAVNCQRVKCEKNAFSLWKTNSFQPSALARLSVCVSYTTVVKRNVCR